jgi:hypothetical protein
MSIEDRQVRLRKSRALRVVLTAMLFVMVSCALAEKDPVGTALLTIKDGYEASVRTAGRLYINRVIDEPQLRQFRDAANKFFQAYNIAVAAHAAGTLTDTDARLDQVKIGLGALEALLQTFSNKGGL